MNDSGTHTSLNQAKFDAWAATYEEKRFDFFRRLQKRVLSILDLKSGSAFLDIGCGTGWAVRQAAEMIGERGAAYGIDLSPKMIEKAKEAASGIRNVRFTQANAEAIPFPDSFFDRIICTMSFHHYLHPAAVTGEIARVLKPGGTVCIVDPTADSLLFKWVDALIRRAQPEHVKLYSTREFQDFFRISGLDYIDSKRVVLIWFTAKAHFATKPSSRRQRTRTGQGLTSALMTIRDSPARSR